MFTRLAALALLALPALVAAAPQGSGANACCDKTISSSSPEAAFLSGLLGVDIGSITDLVGLECSPLNVIALGSGNACSGTSVACDNIDEGGIGLGCVPVSL